MWKKCAICVEVNWWIYLNLEYDLCIKDGEDNLKLKDLRDGALMRWKHFHIKEIFSFLLKSYLNHINVYLDNRTFVLWISVSSIDLPTDYFYSSSISYLAE